MATTSSKKPVKTSTKAPGTQARGAAAKTAESKSAVSEKVESKKDTGKDAAGKSIMSKRKESTSRSASTEKRAGAVIPEKVSSALVSPDKKTDTARAEKTPGAAEAQSSRARERGKSLKQAGGSRQVKKTSKASERAKSGKIKVLRDSYSIPEEEHREIAALKKRCDKHGCEVKKSVLLRAGLQSLAQMDDNELLAAIGRIG